MSRLSSEALSRFQSKIAKTGDGDCWPWLAARAGGRNGETYGVFTLKDPKRMIYSHRLVYAIDNDLDPHHMPSGLVIRHKCDNPICCNPSHLERGTQRDNARDMVERGRSTRGERNAVHVLKENEVVEIKARIRAGDKHQSIASDYGVHRATISQIARGSNWAWLSIPDEAATP